MREHVQRGQNVHGEILVQRDLQRLVCDGHHDGMSCVVDQDGRVSVGDGVAVTGSCPQVLSLELRIHKTERLAFVVQGVEVSLLNKQFVLLICRRRNLTYRFHVETAEPE